VEQLAEPKLRECSLFSVSVKGQTLPDAIDAFFAIDENVAEKETFAMFYSPRRCFLARVANDKTITASSKDDPPAPFLDLSTIFEARVFNHVSEMRWLNDPKGNHTTAVLSETELSFAGKTSVEESGIVGCLSNEYLLWGKNAELEPTEQKTNSWTKFATARTGAFYVPIELLTEQEYAQFTAIEYLKEYEEHDSNVAIVDERLTGIRGSKGGHKNG
jgi:CRISPR-associated protein (TIGR03984 family)